MPLCPMRRWPPSSFFSLPCYSLLERNVVQGRKASRIQAWSNWIREDRFSHPEKWLLSHFVPLAPHLVCKLADSPVGSGIIVQPALIDAHFSESTGTPHSSRWP